MPAVRPVLLSLLLLFTAPLAMAQTPQADYCSLFTAAEIVKLLGTPVDSGEPAGLGTGCQWFGEDEVSYVIIQVVDTTNWFDPRQAPGYEVVAGAGKRAYSHPDEEGGWRAMALTDKATIAVVMIGATAKRASAVTLLGQLLDRL